jgi:hypothetical protein
VIDAHAPVMPYSHSVFGFGGSSAGRACSMAA